MQDLRHEAHKRPCDKGDEAGGGPCTGWYSLPLSYSSTAPAAGSDTVAGVAQTIKLFLAPEPVVPPGSRIEVTQQGRTESYAQSGKAAVYSSHQEILLEIWKEYA